jgi:prevent-host-death family protein
MLRGVAALAQAPRAIPKRNYRFDQLDQFPCSGQYTNMAKPINLYEAKSHLSELVERAADGEEIVIAKAGKPMARLVPLIKKKPRARVFGRNMMGMTHIAPDFYEDLPLDFLLGEKEAGAE